MVHISTPNSPDGQGRRGHPQQGLVYGGGFRVRIRLVFASSTGCGFRLSGL